MKRFFIFLLGFVLMGSLWTRQLFGQDLVLMKDQKSSYQIVLPDQAASTGILQDLTQTARLLQAAFEANGGSIQIRKESEWDSTQPAICLGSTNFARSHGLDTSKLEAWEYVHWVIDHHVVLAGHDHPPKAKSENERRPNWERLGTAKAVADFAREYMGVRFLYPDLRGYRPLREGLELDLLTTPSMEFLKQSEFKIPANLKRKKKPLLRLNIAHPVGSSFYDLALNRFPRVDIEFGNHTWGRAVPEKLYKTNPEYFALVNGTRLKPAGDEGGQYCLSNPEVQRLIYEDIAKRFDQGFQTVDLGHPDGFRACECENCEKLYHVGKDWSEKIWHFNYRVAKRLELAYPEKEVCIMSYILTAKPPQTFTEFPSNTSIMLTGTNTEDIEPWKSVKVPRGFAGYVYNWCANLGTRYTPMRTPSFVEAQVKRLVESKIHSLYRDGPGQLFGLEGPVYYTMGRMFDDPEQLNARILVDEFCEGAFPQVNVRHHMKAFYDELYHAISIYSDFLGTRSPGWQYKLYSSDERTRKSITNPFQLITMLYTPQLMSSLESHLSRSEALANDLKIQKRLQLIRSEFDYIRHLARVAHLHQAWQTYPQADALERLLDAIDARNEFIEGLYDKAQQHEWCRTYFPIPGHSADHLRLKFDGYQEPYANTCFNWDTEKMRQSPPTGTKSMKVHKVDAHELSLHSAEWSKAEAYSLTAMPPLKGEILDSKIQLLWNAEALFVRYEAELGEKSQLSGWKQDEDSSHLESVEVHVRPNDSKGEQFKLVQGTVLQSITDAVRGRISDVMDPRFGKFDPTWNSGWKREVQVDQRGKRWSCLISIPFESLQANPPAQGVSWNANFARTRALPRGQSDRFIWSTSPNNGDPGDEDMLGDVYFEE